MNQDSLKITHRVFADGTTRKISKTHSNLSPWLKETTSLQRDTEVQRIVFNLSDLSVPSKYLNWKCSFKNFQRLQIRIKNALKKEACLHQRLEIRSITIWKIMYWSKGITIKQRSTLSNKKGSSPTEKYHQVDIKL
jgi:hypothetical protein